MTAMTQDNRIDPPLSADERTMLESWLDYHRDTLALKCDGLTAEQLRTASVPPSELTLLGLVRHITEVERAWFRITLAAEEPGPVYFTDEDPDGDFHHPADADPAEAFANWRAEIALAKDRAASRSLDDIGLSTRRRDFSLRWIYLHMIEEYARHNGHADLIRERIDGVTGE